MTKLIPFVAGVLLMQSSFAAVPTLAMTFDTNVKVVNASASQLAKLETAASYVKQIVGSEEFRTAVLNHTYNGQKTFVDNEGLSNEQVYNKILEGAEELNGNPNNTMDIEVELYYNRWVSTVGYTYPDTTRIYMNTKFFNNYTAAEVSGNMIHEWTHKLGFGHSSSYNTARDYSVPYAIGTIMESLAKNIGSITPGTNSGTSTLTPVTNLAVTSTSTNVALKWSAANSSAGIREYKVYRKLEGATTTYLQGTTTALNFNQSAPSKNATYYVKTVDNSGKTINSSTVSYVKSSAVFSAPTNLNITTSGSNVTLTWNASAAKEYKVFRRLEGNSTNYIQTTTSGTSFTQAMPSRNAFYYVRAVDAAGYTLKSAEIKFVR